MRVAVIGLGSMGKRRIRLIKQFRPDIEIVGIDMSQQRMDSAKKEFNIVCEESINKTMGKTIDGVFVCSSPLSHANIIQEMIEWGINVFTEINLTDDGYDDIIEKKSEKGVKVFLSSTFLYRKDVQYIIRQAKGKKVNYMYHTGQYLPDWHPWESYKNFFVADKRTNGCREILAIEFPWIIECFGRILDIQWKKGTLTDLGLDYCDNYLLLLEHENGTKGCIAVDVVARKARRSLEIFGNDLQILWEGTPESLKEFDLKERNMRSVVTYDNIEKDDRYCDNIIENAYMDEIIAFINWVENDSEELVKYHFEDNYDTLKWIDRIEN